MSTLDRISQRNQNFQKSFGRHTRIKNSVELRKVNRLANSINKRLNDQENVLITIKSIPNELYAIAPELLNAKSATEKIDTIESLLLSETEPEKIFTFIKFLRTVSTEKAGIPYFQKKPSLIQHMLSLLKLPNPTTKYEIAWFLTNITTSSTINIITKKNIIDLAHIVQDGFTNEYVIQVIWVLSNLSGDSLENRDVILDTDIGYYIIQGLKSKTVPNHHASTLVWCLSNLLRGNPPPKLGFINGFISLCEIFMNTDREDVFIELLWGISYVTDYPDLIDKVLMVAPLPLLVQKYHKNVEFHHPILRIFGNISCGRNDHTQLVIGSGCTEILLNNLYSDSRTKIRESLWCLSNIVLADYKYTKQLTNKKKFLKIVSFISSEDCEIKIEALHTVLNTLENCEFGDVLKIADKSFNLLEILLNQLTYTVPEVLVLSVSALDSIFASEKEHFNYYGDNQNTLIEKFVQLEGIEKIERLQEHSNDKVYVMASELIKKYWEYEIVSNNN